MFSTGAWRGYWEQNHMGRQLMGPLELRFESGQITGEGQDCVGPFVFTGRYDERGAVVMLKQYLGQHQVLYRGEHDGEGTIFGQWSIGPWDSGAFALSPVKNRAAPDAPIQEL
jgi:hypothetical protein